ncbi:hypothetical protein VTK26DRAFT_5675 [Humicola hyalothermophila]
MAQQQAPGSDSATGSTQAFASDDSTYKDRLAVALGQRRATRGPVAQVIIPREPQVEPEAAQAAEDSSTQSTRAFDSQDPLYKARLAKALGKRAAVPAQLNPEESSYVTRRHLASDEEDGTGPDQRGDNADGPHAASSEKAPSQPTPSRAPHLLVIPTAERGRGHSPAIPPELGSPARGWIDLRSEGDDDGSVELMRVMAVAQSLYSVGCNVSIRSSAAGT